MGWRLLVAAWALLAAACPALAAWPDKPLRLVVGLPSGSTIDIEGRLLADYLSRKLGQPVVVDNRVGASGLVAAKHVANSAPDGYTLLLIGSLAAFETTAKEGVGLSEQFSYVSLVRHYPSYIGVTAKRPFKTFAELVEFGRAHPRQLSYGSIAKSLEFFLAAINKAAGVDAVHVPYRGSAEATTALVAGDIDYYLDATVIFEPQVATGKMRILANTAQQRMPDRPDIPSLKDVGVPGIDLYINFGLVGPKGMPDDVVRVLNEGVREFAALPDVKEKLISVGLGAAVWSTPAEFRAQVDRETVIMRQTAKDLGFEPQ
jgi:tripartite-type tricarboxylate transporter receptor subunit TctC